MNTPTLEFKHRWKRLIFWPYLSFVLFGILIFAGHILISPTFADDVVFANDYATLGNDPVYFALIRYSSWTSRFIIEFFIVNCVSLPYIVWKLIDTTIIVLIGIMFSKMFAPKKHLYLSNVFICCFMLLYAYTEMASAGWIACTVNYVWPFLFGLIALYPIYKAANNIPMKPLERVICSLSLIFSANQEQMCIFLIILYCVYILVSLLNKRIDIYILVQLSLLIACLFNILLCPGNSARFAAEIGRWYPQFDSLTLLSKIKLSFSSLFSGLFLSQNMVFPVVSFLLFVCVCLNHKRLVFKVVAMIPPLAAIFGQIFLSLPDYTKSVVAQRLHISSAYFYHFDIFSSFKTFIAYLFMAAVFVSFLVSIYAALGKTKHSITAIVFFLAGAATKMLMGFSPTVWASGNRTGFFLMFSLIAVAVILLNAWNFENKTKTNLMLFIIIALGIYGAISNFAAII